MNNFLGDIEFASKVHEAIKLAEQKERDNCMELTKEMIKQQYGDVKKLQERIDKAVEYITSYESISTIQGLDKIEQNKILDEKTMIVMVNRYLEVHDKILNILQGKDKGDE